MKQAYQQYIKSLLIYAAIIMAVLTVASLIWPHIIIPSVFSAIFCFFLFINAGFHYLLLKRTHGKGSEPFVKTYLAFTGFKFLAYLFGAVLLVFTMRQPPVPFALNFFVLYVLFTVFEVRQLLKTAPPKA
jgi:hypothetical protein